MGPDGATSPVQKTREAISTSLAKGNLLSHSLVRNSLQFFQFAAVCLSLSYLHSVLIIAANPWGQIWVTVFRVIRGVFVGHGGSRETASSILTGEGGKGASRMKHAIYAQNGKIRRLVPDGLDQIQMFPKGWTADEGDGKKMADGHRAFCMGNALVVGIPHAIGVSMMNSD